MNVVLYPPGARTVWGATACKLSAAARRPPEPNSVRFAPALGVLGIVFTISIPTVWSNLYPSGELLNLL
jgi:hypothetical protein